MTVDLIQIPYRLRITDGERQMTLEQFELDLRKILIKYIDGGLEPHEMCALAEAVLESDDWTYVE